jgi:DNA-binding NtrC family response regulator
MERLKGYDWSRNNIRELRNVIERLVIATSEDLITPEMVPVEIQGSSQESTTPSALGGTLKEQKSAAERQILLSSLERNDWHITNTAQQLGLSDHSSLLKIMKRHGLKK